jgi:hypothetical protein
MHPHRCDQEGALDPATFNYAMRKQIIHYSQCLLAHRMQVMMSHHHTQCHIIIHSVTSSYTVSHHHTQCHIITHSVTSSYIVSHHHT